MSPRPAWLNRRPLGVVEEVRDHSATEQALDALGAAGATAGRLGRSAEKELDSLTALSPLTAPLAADYLERIGRPIHALDLPLAALLTTYGYAAHLAVEARPSAYGAKDIPVLGTLPPFRHGRPPADLANRVVRATRKGFVGICAVDERVWSGLVDLATEVAHRRPAVAPDGETGPGYLAPDVVDGILRFGWVLRQVDLRYGYTPERASG